MSHGIGKTLKRIGSLGISRKTQKRFRSKLGLTGKQIKRKLGLTGVSSAAGVSKDGIYGSTGSIVGRY